MEDYEPSAINQRQPDTLTVESDPLKLDLDGDVLVEVIDARIKASKDFYKDKLKLYERQERNKKYLFGDQLKKGLKYYNARYVDNISYEAEATIKPIAMSRLPDLLVKPGSNTEESKETAKNLTLAINDDVRKRENRTVLGVSFKHLPVYFFGAIKVVWDPQRGSDGDYRFKFVHPDNLVLDHTSSTKSPDDMDFVAEATEISIKEATMRFPGKAKELLETLIIQQKLSDGDENDEKKMASKIKIWEVWFTWWDSAEDPETGEKKWEKIDGVCWKYGALLLGKMKHPYWDWEGKKRLFKYTKDNKKQELSEDEVRAMLFGEEVPSAQSEQFYFNYLKNPSKPYYFMGYDEWGENPMDYTSRIEQIRWMQDNINKRGRQITEMNDRAKGKHVFSTDSGVNKQTIEAMDMNNPDEDILIDGNVGDFHTFIPGQPAPAQLFEEQMQERQKAFAKAGTHSTTRGEKQSDVATTNQILREADFGRIDDLVEETINPAAEWMAMWAMQMIKLFYTKDHMRKLVGKEGAVTFVRINQDSIEDGMEVSVSASGVDKIERKREAFERANLKLTDPLSFFIDTDASDPNGRTEKLLTFMLSPELYMQKYIMGRDSVDKMAQALFAQPVVPAQESPPPTPPAEGQPIQQTNTAAQAGAGGGNPGGFQLMYGYQDNNIKPRGNSLYQVQNSPLNK